MNKLMRAIYQEYQVIPKHAPPKLTPQQELQISRKRKFKYLFRSVGSGTFASGLVLYQASKREQEKYLNHWWDIKKRPARLVTTGPYSFSRNPIYLSYLIMYASTGLFFLPGIIIPVSCFGMGLVAYQFYNETYIPIEEDKLTRAFGAQYIIYKQCVNKWIGIPRNIQPDSQQTAFVFE
eukprot:150869_1